MILAAVTSIPTNPATPTRPFIIPSQSIPDNFFIDVARIRTAVDIPIIITIELVVPFNSIPSLLNTPIAAINSTNKTVMAPNALPKSSALIVEITNIDATNMPIAVAILRSVPALS